MPLKALNYISTNSMVQVKPAPCSLVGYQKPTYISILEFMKNSTEKKIPDKIFFVTSFI